MHSPPRVAQLWRYPVKSMRGEACAALRLDARGVCGDRVLAVRTAEGKIGSGKSTRRFSRIDGLLELRSELSGETVEIVLGDGQRLAANDPEASTVLSRVLGEPVSLAREEAVSHLDAAPVHLVTTAALRALQSALPGSNLGVARFRPNLVVESEGVEPIEGAWLGRTVRIGDGVELRLVGPAERCRMVGLAQAELPPDRAILEQLARDSDAMFGVYAEVITPGTIELGDGFELQSDPVTSRRPG